MTLDPRDQSAADFISVASEFGLSDEKSRRIMGRAIGCGDLSPDSWNELGIIAKEERKLFTSSPRLDKRRISVSPQDGFQKILFSTPDGLPVETVIIPLKKERCLSVCLSSQVGCVMACDFCATGRMKDRRNLEVWEIVDQFIHAREIAREQGKRVTGAVFMGMGEPFLNYRNVVAAAQLISFPVANAISAKAITISTVGLADKIDRFTEEKQPFRLSVSIGAATDEKRALILPVAARIPVKTVMAAAGRYANLRRTRVNIAYVCISGFNVSVEDAQELARLIGDIPVRIDLIDVTDFRGKYLPPNSREMEIFRDALTKYVKQPVVRRYSGGTDIAAACGTLAGEPA